MSEAGSGGATERGCTGDVADDPACWTTDEYGVFVSSDAGDDENGDGTQAKPLATISQGILAATAAGKNVYVCRGEADFYEEQLIITNSSGDGARIYGGFECDGWTHSKTRMVGVSSPQQTALRLKDLKKGVFIENVRFISADGVGSVVGNMSSYGVFITNSQGVGLRRVSIAAGKGADGASGADGEPGADGALPGAGQNGLSPVCPTNKEEAGTPAVWPAPICGSLGGAGGTPYRTLNGGDGADGFPKLDITPPDNSNHGLGASPSTAGTKGSAGASGNPGPLGVVATSAGLFGIGGYTPGDAHEGGMGFPGQGGGGGGASLGKAGCRGAGGGAGGMGGCGGQGGTGGKGGGASVGLLSWNSNVTLEICSIASGNGGAGGAGGRGGSGGPGGNGGKGGTVEPLSAISPGLQGGTGGPGGPGGSGSGAPGGPSYAIVHHGDAPAYDEADTTLTPGLGGESGLGGQVLTEKAPDGSPGDSAEIFEVLP